MGYNDEPVYYCANCLSLHIRELGDVKLDICGECGNTDIKLTSLDNWNKLYTKEYGKVFLTEEDVDDLEE